MSDADRSERGLPIASEVSSEEDAQIEARHGERRPDYIHPRLQPILAETLGVVVFHEQVMRILDELTGCGLGKANVYRCYLSNQVELPEIEAFVCEAALRRGFPPAAIEKAWTVLEGFASFGFSKAHRAAFALPTYQSAFLKTHYPAAHMAGLLTHDPGLLPKDLLVAEARHLGVPLLPMDVQHSTAEYLLEPTADRRRQDRGTHGPHRSVRIDRKRTGCIAAHQPFTSLQDFRDRVRPRRSTFESLARVGVLDAFIEYDRKRRHELLAHVRRISATPIRVPEGQLAFDFDLPVPRYEGVVSFDLHGAARSTSSSKNSESPSTAIRCNDSTSCSASSASLRHETS